MDQKKKIPGPNAYQKIEPMVEPIKNQKKIIFKDNKDLPSKNTFIDQILKKKVPGPGHYKTEVSEFRDPPTKDEIRR